MERSETKQYRPRVPITATDEERLHWHGWGVVESGCWESCAGRNKQNYAVLANKYLHRLAYETWVGPIPEGHVVRHKCDNPPCVNPSHLETGTKGENNKDTGRRSRSGRLKLSRADVEDIRWVLGLGAVQAEVARAYEVTPTQISNIRRGLQRIL